MLRHSSPRFLLLLATALARFKYNSGSAAFKRLLHDARFEHAAFIAETPVDEPGDEMRNVMALRALSAG